jgi:prepilin-type processing-associated H-X9-DG protein
MSENNTNNPIGLGYIKWNYSAKTGMMICPERTKPRTSAIEVDYAVPTTLGRASAPWRLSDDKTLMKVDSVRIPSCLGWAGDANDYGGFGYWDLRHYKAVNVLFVDLHVEHLLKLPPLSIYNNELIVNIGGSVSYYPFSGNR